MVSPTQNSLIQSYIGAIPSRYNVGPSDINSVTPSQQAGAIAPQNMSNDSDSDTDTDNDSLGGDALVAQATGLGGQLDVIG